LAVFELSAQKAALFDVKSAQHEKKTTRRFVLSVALVSVDP
jgi:hypothetical protein